MACTHIGPHELIEMAEAWLRQENVAVDSWRGRRFAFGENLENDMWSSVALEIERRGDEWIVTRLDRSGDRLPPEGIGFRPLR